MTLEMYLGHLNRVKYAIAVRKALAILKITCLENEIFPYELRTYIPHEHFMFEIIEDFKSYWQRINRKLK